MARDAPSPAPLPPVEVADEATQFGAALRLRRSFGNDPLGLRLSTEIGAEAAVGTFEYDGTRISIVDTPGYPDFVAEVDGAMFASDLRLSRSLDGAKSWSVPVGVGVEPVAMSQRPRLDVDRDGTVRAVWYDSRAADWRWHVFASTQLPSAEWSEPVQLTTAGNSTWPAISHGVVVFTSDRRSERVQRDVSHEVFMIRAARKR